MTTVVQGGNLVLSKEVTNVVVSFAEGATRATGTGGVRTNVARSASTLPPEIQAKVNRKRKASDLDAAEAAKGEADAIRTRYDTGMAAARDAAQARVATAQAQAVGAAEVRLKDLAAVIDGKATAATTRLNGARDTARATLAATTTELTAQAVMRLTGLNVPAADIEAVLSAQK